MNSISSFCLSVTTWVAALTADVPAQFYWPPGYATAPGNAVMNAPFTTQPGYSTSGTRCMVVIDPSSLPFPVGTALTRISLRRDVGYASQSYSGKSGNLIVRIGRAAWAPSQVQDVRFSRVWETPPTQVFAQTPFAIPAASAPGTSVPPFSLVIPFTTNYTWQGGPLAIEFVFTSAAGPSAWRLDAFAVNRPQNGTSSPTGLGCRGSNGFIPWHYALPETSMPGAQMTVQMEGSRLPPAPGAAETYAFHMLGTQNLTYLGSPLPLPLSLIGGPPQCLLRIEPLLITTCLVSNPSALFARATNSFPIPAQAAFVGFVLHSQWLLFDTGIAASFPMTVSDALAITLGGVLPPAIPQAARTLWKYGATGFDDEYGSMVPDSYGPIIKFN